MADERAPLNLRDLLGALRSVACDHVPDGQTRRIDCDECMVDAFRSVARLDALPPEPEEPEGREGLRRKPPIGDWLLEWFGDNAPAHSDGGYTFSQIADCANWIGRHLDAAMDAEREREGSDAE